MSLNLDFRPLGCLLLVVGGALGVALWHLAAWAIRHIRVEWIS